MTTSTGGWIYQRPQAALMNKHDGLVCCC